MLKFLCSLTSKKIVINSQQQANLLVVAGVDAPADFRLLRLIVSAAVTVVAFVDVVVVVVADAVVAVAMVAAAVGRMSAARFRFTTVMNPSLSINAASITTNTTNTVS